MPDDKKQTSEQPVEDDPKRVHFLTIRLDEAGGPIIADVTGVSDLEAVKMLEGVLELMDCNMPEVVIMRDGQVAYTSNGNDDDDDEED